MRSLAHLALVVALLAAPALAGPDDASKAPPPAGLKSSVVVTPEDLDWLHEQLERLAATKALGVLDDEAVKALRAQLGALAATVAVSGELEDAPLTEALDAVVAACRLRGEQGAVGLVLSQATRERLAEVTVTASFSSTPVGAALQALVAAANGGEVEVELDEVARRVFVVRAHERDDDDDKDDDDDDDDDAKPEQAPPEGQAPEGEHGWLGVSLAEDDEAPGVGLAGVVEGGAAAAAGLQAGDVVLFVDAEALDAGEDLRALVAARPAGAVVHLVVRRGEDLLGFAVTLGERP